MALSGKGLLIFGSGDIAKLAEWYFRTDGGRTAQAFVVDDAYLDGDRFQGLPLVGFSRVERDYPPERYEMFVALSYRNMNRDRQRVCLEAKGKGYTLASYISSRCTYLAETKPGENAFILENNTIQPFVTIGDNVTLWSGNHIGHDAVIEDNVFIASHAVISGRTVVGRNAFIGVNATVSNGLRIAPFTTIGAGALIMKSTRDADLYPGSRSKALRRRLGADERPE